MENKYILSFDALVVGFLMKPSQDNTDEVKLATAITGDMLLNIAHDMSDKEQRTALLAIVYAISQMVGVEQLEQKSSKLLSIDLNDEEKNLLSKLHFDIKAKIDNPIYIDYFINLAKISGVKNFKQAFEELDDLAFALND